jgi:dephospho-CoA kinase
VVLGKWPEKYVIGLTGNIGTGKSVVRRMLEHLGAYGIDADQLAHRAIAKGAPGYQKVLETFGKWVLAPDGEIDRAKLASITFSNPIAMADLEAIVHPLVTSAIDLIIKRASQKVIVVEAIKLIESGLGKNCDAIWVSYAFPELQLNRLVRQRHMSEFDARERIAAQPPQEDKIASATVIIKNISTFEETWRQVVAAWKKFVPGGMVPAPAVTIEETKSPQGTISIQRGGPGHCLEIADLYNRLSKNHEHMTEEKVMEAFGEKAFMLLTLGNKVVGIIGWQVENLISRTMDILIDPKLPAEQVIPMLMKDMEQASRDLQCEASLLFAEADLASKVDFWKGLGYERRAPETLGVLAWQEAALESMPPNSVLFFKQLRVDRVLRPI